MSNNKFVEQYPEIDAQYFEAREQFERDYAQEQEDFEAAQWQAFEDSHRDDMKHLLMRDTEGFLL